MSCAWPWSTSPPSGRAAVALPVSTGPAGCVSGHSRPAPRPDPLVTGAVAACHGHRRLDRSGLSRSGVLRRRPAEAPAGQGGGGDRRQVAKPLGLSTVYAALGIHRVVNAQMAEGIRLVSVRGRRPAPLHAGAAGRRGDLHATALAHELGIGRIVVPRLPGVLSAIGLLAAPVEHEVTAEFATPLAALDVAGLRQAGRGRSPGSRADGGGEGGTG